MAAPVINSAGALHVSDHGAAPRFGAEWVDTRSFSRTPIAPFTASASTATFTPPNSLTEWALKVWVTDGPSGGGKEVSFSG